MNVVKCFHYKKGIHGDFTFKCSKEHQRDAYITCTKL